MSEPGLSKKEPKAELEDLLEQRKALRNMLSTDAARAAYEELTLRIVSLKKRLDTI